MSDRWTKLILVGRLGDGFAGMSGYCFDAAGKAHPTSPRGDTIRAMKKLAEIMLAESPTGRRWVSCLLRIGSDGQFGVDFEYVDAQRWAINLGNVDQRIAEFGSMPV